MKGKLLTFLLLAILISSCSSIEQPEDTSIIPDNSIEEAKFLSFNISQPKGHDSRNDNNGDWSLESGTTLENNIKSIFFYFFDKEGNTIKVKKGLESDSQFQFAYEWLPSEGNLTESGPVEDGTSYNFEKTLSGSLALRFDDDELPEQVMTVVNPGRELKDLVVTNISDLQGAVEDLYTGLTEDNFVMTNSVYVIKNHSQDTSSDGEPTTSSSQSVICATQITPDKICSSLQESLQHPVEIWVERVLARIDLRFLMEETQGFTVPEGQKAFKTSAAIKREGDSAETEIYVKFLGWAVTSTPKKSRLFKMVDNAWDVDNFFSVSSSWNSSALHRSVWGVNPEDLQLQWFTFNDLIGQTGDFDYGETYNMDVSTGYMQENANPYSEGAITLSNPDYPSKAIFASQIVDASGNYIELAEYEGKYYKVSDLQTLIAEKLDMWFADEEGNNIYKIKPNHLSFQTAMERSGQNGTVEKDTYYVYFTLSSEVKDWKWYHHFNSEDEKESSEIINTQSYIDRMTAKAKVWTRGYAYYYFDIPHCIDISTDKPGSLGVVRNNIYRSSIEAVTQLGTPVYKPGEMIYPETPESTDNPLVVNVKKLDWRIEHQDVLLSW